MKKTNPVVLYVGFLFLVLGLSFLSHTFLLAVYEYPPYGNRIVFSYIVNFLLASSIFGGLYALRNTFKNQIGFLFMGGSFIKFIVFFIFFYPAYRSDGVVDKLEFAAFFIPYAIGLAIETFFTAKMLQKQT
ncbi:DUF6168 family protein [Arenibacter sp. GZD96]|uniref:DUF6168 family protein n=1 Tax=Aurantibrevibacter litoralis TaxID=3106030 RepID=UPI002AFE4376|nr:DUF6168 family protein [Arenibacter sp. GZD-96]MEA1786630.1 DUF6168 family protein [Arenibacter sp. GZD-96]